MSGLTGALVLLSLCKWLEDAVPSLSTATAWGGVAALLLYVGCYQVQHSCILCPLRTFDIFGCVLQFSFGPIVWLLVGELYPLEVRTEGIALCTFTNFGNVTIIE